jgi:hypothetical protein
MTAIRIEEEDAIPIPDVPHKLFTLVLVRDYANDRVLLGEKLRGTFLHASSRVRRLRGARMRN